MNCEPNCLAFLLHSIFLQIALAPKFDSQFDDVFEDTHTAGDTHPAPV